MNIQDDTGLYRTRFSVLRTALTPFRMPDLNSSGMPVIYWTGMLKDQFSGRQNHLRYNPVKIILRHLFGWPSSSYARSCSWSRTWVTAVLEIEVQILVLWVVVGGWWVQMVITETYENAYQSLSKEKKIQIKQQILLNIKVHSKKETLMYKYFAKLPFNY